jgi:CheY-like chemotaxis protein
MPRRAAKRPPAKQPLRVLVVDDCQDTLSCFQTLLSKSGFEVATAYNANKAVDSAKENPPDVLVMDINLPVIDGYDIAEELVLLLPKKPLCIAMTGFPKDRTRAEAIREGFNFYLTKPVNATELVDIIQKYAGMN